MKLLNLLVEILTVAFGFLVEIGRSIFVTTASEQNSGNEYYPDTYLIDDTSEEVWFQQHPHKLEYEDFTTPEYLQHHD